MRKIAAIGVGLAVATFGLTAMAEEPAPAPAGGGAAAAAPAAGSPGGISVAALGGMGFKSVDTGGGESLNVYGVGVGARGGYTLPGMNIYLGAQFIYHLGASKDVGVGKVENKILFYGVEAGYELPMGGLTLRPSIHVGQAKYTAKATISFLGQSQEVDASETRFALSPGATLLYGLGGSLFVGADFRYHIVSDANAPAIYGTIGAKF